MHHCRSEYAITLLYAQLHLLGWQNRVYHLSSNDEKYIHPFAPVECPNPAGAPANQSVLLTRLARGKTCPDSTLLCVRSRCISFSLRTFYDEHHNKTACHQALSRQQRARRCSRCHILIQCEQGDESHRKSTAPSTGRLYIFKSWESCPRNVRVWNKPNLRIHMHTREYPQTSAADPLHKSDPAHNT